jgi:hypothetical protein
MEISEAGEGSLNVCSGESESLSGGNTNDYVLVEYTDIKPYCEVQIKSEYPEFDSGVIKGEADTGQKGNECEIRSRMNTQLN